MTRQAAAQPRTRRARLIACAAAIALLVITAGPALAGEPDPGHADLFQHDPGDARISLDWHLASQAYPGWFQSNVQNELETAWSDPAANNSNVPRFDDGNDASGGGTIVYTSQASSPCTGSTIWIGCNPAGGTRSFAIYVRAFPSPSAPTWLWYQRDNTCSDLYDGSPNPNDGYPTSVCFSVLRVVAHESTHVTLLRPHYDAGADDETIMQSTTPTPNGSPDDWNRRNFLPCDAAAAQLEYGPADAAGKYADCFATTPGDGAKGLNTSLTVTSGASSTRCVDTIATVGGRLALANSAAYEDMRNWPLAGRVVRIDRKPAASSTWTNGVLTAIASPAGGSNWSKAVTSSGSGVYDYRASWSTGSGELALNSSNVVTWTITWTTAGCPV
jgi:hypothetical protein